MSKVLVLYISTLHYTKYLIQFIVLIIIISHITLFVEFLNHGYPSRTTGWGQYDTKRVDILNEIAYKYLCINE